MVQFLNQRKIIKYKIQRGHRTHVVDTKRQLKKHRYDDDELSNVVAFPNGKLKHDTKRLLPSFDDDELGNIVALQNRKRKRELHDANELDNTDIDNGDDDDVDDDDDNNDGDDDNDDDYNIFECESISKSECIQAFYGHINTIKESSAKLKRVKRINHILAWAFYETNKSNLHFTNVEEWTYELLTQHSQLVAEYCYKYLKDTLGHNDATIKGFMYTVMDPYVHWYVDIRKNCKNHFAIDESTFGAYNRLSNSIKKVCKQKMYQQRNKKTKAAYIENQRLPPGDANLKLKTLCEDEFETFKQIDFNYINATTYAYFMQAFCLAFYIVPQGRPRAIENLSNADAQLLLQNKSVVQSTLFKTSSSLGFQPIQSHPLLRY